MICIAVAPRSAIAQAAKARIRDSVPNNQAAKPPNVSYTFPDSVPLGSSLEYGVPTVFGVKRNDSLLNGALIGAAIGSVVGYVVLNLAAATFWKGQRRCGRLRNRRASFTHGGLTCLKQVSPPRVPLQAGAQRLGINS